MSGAPEVSVVVPLFNEEATIDELVQRIAAALRARGASFEVVLVDDGSTDGSAAVLERLEREHPAVRVVRLARNQGQSVALCRGLVAARGQLIVTMDGDLQNPPEEIPRLLDAFAPGVDLVTAYRSQRHEPGWRWLGSRLVHWFARLLIGGSIRDYGGQFKAYRRAALDATRAHWAPGKPFFALAVWLGFPVAEVEVRHAPRRAGQSRYRFAALLRLLWDIVTTFATPPILACAALGLGLTASGVLMAVLQRWAEPVVAAPGLASLLLVALGSACLLGAVRTTRRQRSRRS